MKTILNIAAVALEAYEMDAQIRIQLDDDYYDVLILEVIEQDDPDESHLIVYDCEVHLEFVIYFCAIADLEISE